MAGENSFIHAEQKLAQPSKEFFNDLKQIALYFNQ
jgi:hypothetical protein